LIAVDSIDADLRRIVEFVNTRGNSGSRLHLVALAFPRFAEGSTQVIVPETFGDEISPATDAPERRTWTEALILEYLSGKGEDVLQVVSSFRDWADSRGFQVVFDGDRREGWSGSGDRGARRGGFKSSRSEA
jgi:hypothetical protein